MKLLLALLIIIAVIMVILGVMNNIIPPILTGAGFIVIAVILFKMDNKK